MQALTDKHMYVVAPQATLNTGYDIALCLA